MNVSHGWIGAVALAVPEFQASQGEVLDFFLEHHGERLRPGTVAVMKKVFGHPGIRRRRFAIQRREEMIDELPDQRVERFTRWAQDLSEQAVRRAMEQAGLQPAEVGALIVNTCTGYICPGVSTYLVERLGLSPDTLTYDLVGGGCGGAIPNLQLADRVLSGLPDERVVLSIAVEICSATMQMGDDLSLVVSNALFADGAAAVVLWHRPEGLALEATASRLAPEYREDIRFIHRNGQLYNQLSPQLAQKVSGTIAGLVDELLGSSGLTRRDIPHWALHGGGDKVLEAVQRVLGLEDTQVAPSRGILAEYGNMSSPSVWFALKAIWDNGIAAGERCMLLSYGAGFAVHGFLLRALPEGENRLTAGNGIDNI